MKKNCLLLILFVFMVGCAAGRTQIVQPKKTGFHNYQVLEILDYQNNAGSEVPTGICQRLPDEIAKQVMSLNLFQAVNRMPVMTTEGSGNDTLVLKGIIIEYDPGSRGKRYLAGFTGWGKAFVTVQLTAIDKSSGEEIFKGNIGSELSGGLFGGSFDDAVKKLVEESIECIQANY